MVNVRVLIILLFILGGCTRGPQVTSYRWTSSGSTPLPPEILVALSEAQSGKTILLGNDQKILRKVQMVDGVPVENTSLQVLKNKRGETEYAAIAFLDHVPKQWGKRIAKLQAKKEVIASKWRSTIGKRWSNLATEVDVLIAQRPSRVYVPALRIRVLEEVQGQVRDYLYRENGHLADQKITALSGVDGVGRVFLGSPDRSRLEDQILRSLLGDGSLTGAFVKLFSADGKSPLKLDNDFRFNPDQREFDDVQAYFFADQHSRWFEETLNFKLPAKLDVKLHVGAPVPSNAMFYYANQVRLGDGDGVTYRGIPRDPSIVKHEVSHAYVEALAGLGFEGEAGSYSEAFADLFAALADAEPVMAGYAFLGGDGRRSLVNELRADKDLGKGKYESSLVISGTFWDLKEAFGSVITAKLARAFLVRLGPNGTFSDFQKVFADSIRAELEPEQQAIALGIINRRGWGTK